MAKYLSCAETAKLIRQALKESFEDVKFSVKSSTYSGGASITVRWTDGPNESQVKAVAGTFSGAYFDGMTDFKGSTFAMIDGEQVRFGADFIFCNRKVSRELCEKIVRRFHFAEPMKVKGSDDLGWWVDSLDCSAAQHVRMAIAKHSDRLAVAPSKTAGRVIYLGNDGYSEIGALHAK
jgi:hypothetical protein